MKREREIESNSTQNVLIWVNRDARSLLWKRDAGDYDKKDIAGKVTAALRVFA